MRIRDELKEIAIRQKAIEIIVREGLDGLNMKDLALACGISASTIYVYYKNKEDLIFQLCLSLRIDILKSSIKGLTADMPFKDGLLLQWKNRFRYFMDHPLNIQASEQLRYTPQHQKATEPLIEAVKPDLGPFIDNAVKNGELAEMPFELYWAIGFAPLHLLIEFHIANSSYANDQFSISDELIEEAVTRIAKALAK